MRKKGSLNNITVEVFLARIVISKADSDLQKVLIVGKRNYQREQELGNYKWTEGERSKIVSCIQKSSQRSEKKYSK